MEISIVKKMFNLQIMEKEMLNADSICNCGSYHQILWLFEILPNFISFRKK